MFDTHEQFDKFAEQHFQAFVAYYNQHRQPQKPLQPISNQIDNDHTLQCFKSEYPEQFAMLMAIDRGFWVQVAKCKVKARSEKKIKPDIHAHLSTQFCIFKDPSLLVSIAILKPWLDIQ